MIYFIQCGDDGPVKIGTTSGDIDDRLSQLQVGCPYPLRILWEYYGDEYSEKEIHQKFSHLNIRGEWFKFEEDLFVFIKDDLELHKEIAFNINKEFYITESIDGSYSFGCADATIQVEHRKTIIIDNDPDWYLTINLDGPDNLPPKIIVEKNKKHFISEWKSL